MRRFCALVVCAALAGCSSRSTTTTTPSATQDVTASPTATAEITLQQSPTTTVPRVSSTAPTAVRTTTRVVVSSRPITTLRSTAQPRVTPTPIVESTAPAPAYAPPRPTSTRVARGCQEGPAYNWTVHFGVMVDGGSSWSFATEVSSSGNSAVYERQLGSAGNGGPPPPSVRIDFVDFQVWEYRGSQAILHRIPLPSALRKSVTCTHHA
jgi:hypothetical protein